VPQATTKAPVSRRRSAAEIASWVFPAVAILALALTWEQPLPWGVEVALAIPMVGAVLAAVRHAEVVAHKVGEPWGSLILAVAVTVIEVGLIVTLMLSGEGDTGALARDTVFSAVMICSNGIFGLVLLSGGRRRRVAVFNPEGTAAEFATVIALAALCLVLPAFTIGVTGPVFTGPQLAFAAVAALVLYGLFVFVQNHRHRDYFLPPAVTGTPTGAIQTVAAQAHAAPPTTRATLLSAGLLVVALLGVVGLAKIESHPIETAVVWAGLPGSFVGVLIALLVLLPETIAAVRNALRGRVQIGVNLALGSAIASVGLTIPVMAVVSIWIAVPLQLGLGGVQIVLLVLTAGVGILTVIPGRATVLQAAIHLSIAAAFLFLTAVP
jgi:Ca2+:H+ antiporter